MVNSCSVYGCKSNYRTTGKSYYVHVFKFPDKTIKQAEWLRKLPKNVKAPKLQKHPQYVSNILNHTSSSDTMYFYVQMVILIKL